MNEIITVCSKKYTATNVITGLNTISFTLSDLTADEVETVFKSVESLTVSDDQNNVYGEYPNVVYKSVTKDADGNVSVSMSILAQEQVQIKELQTSQAKQDEAIAELLYGGCEE